MKTKATSGSKTITSDDVTQLPPTALVIPVRVLTDPVQSLALGFRMEMLTMGDLGEVATGSGLGTDFIHLKWGEHHAVVRGSELLRAFVQQVAPKDAERFPAHVKAAPL